MVSFYLVYEDEEEGVVRVGVGFENDIFSDGDVKEEQLTDLYRLIISSTFSSCLVTGLDTSLKLGWKVGFFVRY